MANILKKDENGYSIIKDGGTVIIGPVQQLEIKTVPGCGLFAVELIQVDVVEDMTVKA